MVEDIEKLTLEAQLQMLGQGKPFGQVEVAPEKIGTAQRVATEVSELTGLSVVLVTPRGIALPRARINGRDESIRIQPLQRSCLSDTRYGMMLIQRNSGTTPANSGPLPCTMPFPPAE